MDILAHIIAGLDAAFSLALIGAFVVSSAIAVLR